MDIKGKVAVVTGGASGIGRALATRFVNDGAKQVVIADLNEEGLNSVADEIGARAIRTDVSNESDVINLIKTAEKDYGQIDILCNNAGIGLSGGPEVENEGWEKIWQINVMAHVYAARAAIPAMLERGEGYIVNTASAAGLLSQVGSAPYAVTKHAAVGFAEWIALTYADRGLKVSVLCPQAVRTAMTAGNEDGVASQDGMMEPEVLCDSVMDAIEKETFLIIPHQEVLKYMQNKASDYDRWIRGMSRLHTTYGDNSWP